MNTQLGVDAAGPPGAVVSSRVSGWRAVVRVLRSPARTVLDDLVTTVFPGDCRCCEAPLQRLSTVPVCETCVGRVVPHQVLGCGCCGDDLDLDIDMEDARFAGMLAQRLLCRECRLARPDFERAVAYGSYDFEMRALIALLKFHRVASVAKLLGRRMADAVLQLENEAAAELLVIAVPLFKAREHQRGYNQSILLADEALRWLKRLRPKWNLVPAHAALVRRTSTESSFVLSRRDRRRNLSGAFKVRDNVRGKEVLLIDDILTSGATARECARVLRRAGAAKVWVATLARAQRRSKQTHHPADQVATWDMAAVQTF